MLGAREERAIGVREHRDHRAARGARIEPVGVVRHHDADAPVADFSLGPHRFEFSARPYLMGVVNLSADSWYSESVVLNADAAIRRGRVLHEQGAAIIDVGAESTLAHAALVDGVG